MITYSTNWMGPINMAWYRERNLTVTRTVVQAEDSKFTTRRKGDIYETEEITVQYSAGRIDIRDDTKEGYAGWDEYSVAPMLAKDWNALSDYLDDLTTEELLSYNDLIEQFETHLGRTIVWADEPQSDLDKAHKECSI